MISRLTYCEEGFSVVIKDLNAGIGALQNLNNLGLNIGDTIKLLENSRQEGPLSVEFNSREIRIGRELAGKILIETESPVIVTLDQVKVGDIVEVTKMNSAGDIRYRLLDMGLVRGVKLKVIRFAPLGDPIEVKINEFMLSLRLEEARSIEVKILEFGLNGYRSKKRWWTKG
ncbi:MAG: ferrous iron transport protein A [Melioribacteraceae bacterium]|nr:ferrous iron transport protein A [Melioribacteraceae bacterium]